MKNLKVIFMGTPEFAINVLESLINNTNVIMVVCQPDKVKGRHNELVYPPIKELALKNNIPCFQPINIKEDYQEIIDMNPDIIITCAYGQIIPKELLELPKYGCINVHASLLPKLRGGAPINHAIIDGYDKTGITIMHMAEGMDDGNIIYQEEYMIKDNDTFGNVSNELSIMGANLLIKSLPNIIDGSSPSIKQDDNLVTFAKIIKREDEHIDFNKKGIEIDRLVRGLNPYPYANTIIDDIEFKVIEGYYENKESTINKIELKKDAIGIGCIDGYYYITKIKPAGKKEMLVKDYLNGVNKEKLINAIVK